MTVQGPLVREQRKNRLTGTTISLEDTHHPDSTLDPDGGRWATVCEGHSNLVNHTTLALARFHMAVPEWCEDCQEILRRDHPEIFA